MAKDTTVGARVEAELKERAQGAFDKMGLPMSLGIELFLRQVADTGKLPFALAAEEEAEDAKQQEQERDFWRSFICWYFDAWPMFDSKEAEKLAREEYDFDIHQHGRAIQTLIDAEEPATEEQRRAAARELFELRNVASNAKELIYWALGMEKVFPPTLSATYGEEADAWRLRHLQAKSRGFSGLGRSDDDACIPCMDDLDDGQLMELFDEWVMESGASDEVERLLMVASESANSFDDIRPLLEAVGLLDDFEDYAEDMAPEMA